MEWNKEEECFKVPFYFSHKNGDVVKKLSKMRSRSACGVPERRSSREVQSPLNAS